MYAAFPLMLALTAAPARAGDGPTVIVEVVVGVPNLLHGHAELFVADAWSLELGGGVGLLPPTVTVGTRWSPAATCWGCWEGHGLRLAPGVTWFILPTQLQEGLVVVDVDLAWVWRAPSGWGMTAGVRVGAGPAYGVVADGAKIEPGIEVVPLQLGLIR